MKKLLGLTLAATTLLALTACGSNKKTLKILNWGDYLDADLVDEFEKENNCKVKCEDVESNETMYGFISDNRDNYDIVVPSDYMIEKLHSEGKLKEIDFSKLENYKEGMFRESLNNTLSTDAKDIKNYFIPYFWGSLGLMYRTDKEGLAEAVEKNGFNCLFNKDLLPKGTKVGMYDCARDAFAAAELALGYSLNTTDDTELKACRDLLKSNKSNYTMYGTDNLKTSVAEGNLDLALVYSGDFFDQRYIYSEEELDINFDIYAPTEHNNVFFDGLVIPTTSKETDLALKFIDFMLDKENSFTNTDTVGYAPVIEAVNQMFIDYGTEGNENYDEYYDELMKINAYNPDLITNGEFYKYLGKDFDAKLEKYFAEAKA